jgi:hypothetical protein
VSKSEDQSILAAIVLAANLGTKGWGWRSWGVGNSESGNIAGVKWSLARVVEGGNSLLFGFSKRTHRAKSDRYSKI